MSPNTDPVGQRRPRGRFDPYVDELIAVVGEGLLSKGLRPERVPVRRAPWVRALRLVLAYCPEIVTAELALLGSDLPGYGALAWLAAAAVLVIVGQEAWRRHVEKAQRT